MATGFFHVPTPKNEPVKEYRPGSPEKTALKAALQELRSKETDVPMYIGGQKSLLQISNVWRRHTIINIHWGISLWVTPAM